MKKAIIYTRASFSLSDCSLAPIEAQVLSCKEFAEKNDIDIIGVRADIITVGTKDNFAAWRSIVNNRKPDYDYILVRDYSRIGRNRSQVVKDHAKLKEKSVRLLSVTESLSDEYDEVLFDLLSEYSHKRTK